MLASPPAAANANVSRQIAKIQTAMMVPSVARPEIVQPASVRLAVVLTLWLLDPASGSVNPNAIFLLPSAIGGSHRTIVVRAPSRGSFFPLQADP